MWKFQGGIYVFQIFDFYAASGVVLLTICFFECICVGYFYGADKFYEDIKRMVGFRLTPWFKYCWLYFAPIVTLVRTCLFILKVKVRKKTIGTPFNMRCVVKKYENINIFLYYRNLEINNVLITCIFYGCKTSQVKWEWKNEYWNIFHVHLFILTRKMENDVI